MKILSLFNHPITLTMSLMPIVMRQFPDGETYLRFTEVIAGESLVFIDSLNQPNEKIMPLLFAAQTAKELGAQTVTLIAPYLAYMRQDIRFNSGEAITSNYFAALLSKYFDRLLTVDPHLHRHHHLSDIYSIPTTVISAAPAIALWIKNNVNQPLLIGPDSESQQWVAQIAQGINAPFIILEKNRYGDRHVAVTAPEVTAYQQHTPVLIDDIISTGQTCIAATQQLLQLNMRAPICIGVHAVFAQNAYQDLLQAGASKIITTNTIAHPSNQIDLTHEIMKQV